MSEQLVDTKTTARDPTDGLAVLDKIAAGGVAAGGNGPDDGAPNVKVTITSADVNTNATKN